MALREDFERQGNWLFRWRSYLPLLLLPLLIIALLSPENSTKSEENTFLTLYKVFCVSLSFAGLLIRCLIIGYIPRGTSGRNTKRQKAATLNTTGIYSMVRHPLYLGNFTIFFGLVLSVQVWWFALIFILTFWLYYERIMFAEEAFLRDKFGEAYLAWAAKTPAFIPRFKNWQKPDIPFSFKYILKREYSGLFGIIIGFVSLEIIKGLLTEGKFRLSADWMAFFSAGLIVYLLLRTLKKKTKVLSDEKR